MRQVRAAFVACGGSLCQWCDHHGVRHQNARKALLGEWEGPKAQALRLEICHAALGEAFLATLAEALGKEERQGSLKSRFNVDK